MADVFEIKNGKLEKYNGTDEIVNIPDGVTEIGVAAFRYCKSIKSVIIPNGVTEIGPSAFLGCTNLSLVSVPRSLESIWNFAFYDCRSLAHITLTASVKRIANAAFGGCVKLADKKGFVIRRGILFSYYGPDKDVIVPDTVTTISGYAFEDRTDLTSITLPESVTEIGDHAFINCSNLTSLTIPGNFVKIGYEAFKGCKGLGSFVAGDALHIYYTDDAEVTIPEGVKVIKEYTFMDNENLTSITIPEGVTKIEFWAFRNCTGLTTITLPDTVTEIGDKVFENCENLTTVFIPAGVTSIGEDIFEECRKVTVICIEGSAAHQYCLDNGLNYLFDYQYAAFNGLIPQGFERLASPFLADEEKPYIFISYSHLDRDKVLNIIKSLYESGWKIWYDEGLTIGDRYDDTLEEHVRNCSAFLLFVTGNSLNSFYVKENEIPWAQEFGKPIIKCILDEGWDYQITGDPVIATVPPDKIEPALERVGGLTKGAPRTATGISVVVNPADRDGAEDGGFAYCVYSRKNVSAAKAIMLEARNSGCQLYDAVENGEDAEMLRSCACLTVFLDKAFLTNKRLSKILIDHYKARRDIAICQMEEIEEKDLPKELRGLHLMQWLNYVYGITADMNTKLARHLQKRGCRNRAVLPGFEYEETDEGIVITKYTGMDPDPRIEREYGGVPVVEIAKEAFKNCIRLKSVVIDGVPKIGEDAFAECEGLTTVTLGEGVREIGPGAFMECTSLASINIPDGVEVIGVMAFEVCKSLTSLILPDSVRKIGGSAFSFCEKLTSMTIPFGVEEIEEGLFCYNPNLRSVDIPDSVRKIGGGAFQECPGLVSITIPDVVTEIGDRAFNGCTSLTSIVIPDSVRKIGGGAFGGCAGLPSFTVPKGAEVDFTAFRGCTGLVDSEGFLIVGNVLYSYEGNAAEVTVPDGVTMIESFAFSENAGLNRVTLPSSLTEIHVGVFEDCPNLTSVSVPKSVKKIWGSAFEDCPRLTVTCPPRSEAWRYCTENDIPVAAGAGTGLFGKLFGR